MLCEKCRIREATIQYTEVVNGRRTVHSYCSQCAKDSDFGGSSWSRVGLVLDLPAEAIAEDMPIEVEVTYQNRYSLHFGELHADGAFDQYDTKAPVFSWSPLHESL